MTIQQKELPKIIDKNVVLQKLGLSKSSLTKLRTRFDFPKPYMYSKIRSLRWVESEVDAWIIAQVGASEPVVYTRTDKRVPIVPGRGNTPGSGRKPKSAQPDNATKNDQA